MDRILLLIIVSNATRIICGSSCTEWELIDDVTYSLQKRCEYNRITEEKNIMITPNASNYSQTYNVIIKSDATCYDPQLVIDFDAMPLHDDAYYSFYIWQENIDKNTTYLPIIEHYKNVLKSQCVNISRRVFKTSPNENTWAVIDDEYKQLIESQTLNDKTKEIGVKIFISPQISSSICTEMSNVTYALNARITFNCSTAFDWEFDFEDNQTIWIFSVCLIIFSCLLSFTICRTRFIELKEQYTLYQHMDENTVATCDVCCFGCCCNNEHKRCYWFISHDDDNEKHYPLANTWLWYVLSVLIIPIYAVSMALLQTDFMLCHFQCITVIMSASFTSLFVMDLDWCTARWFGRDFCIRKKKAFDNKCICDENMIKRARRSCPYIAYIYGVICYLIAIVIFFSVCELDNELGLADRDLTFGVIVALSFVPGILVSLAGIPYTGYWLFTVVFSSVLDVHNFYVENWSMVFVGMPTALMVLFLSDQEGIHKLLPPFIGLAVSLYDVFSDINLILLWWESSKIWWAVFQILFIFMGQIVAAIDEYGLLGSNALAKETRRESNSLCENGCGCLLTTIGGRIKYGFTINISDKKNNNEAIMQTLKINEMVWESVYSVALQLYIATLFDQFNGTLIFSLVTSFANVTDSLYHFIENNKHRNKVANKQWVTWIIWLYIVTDFLHRIIPNIALSVLIDQQYVQHYGMGDYVFYIAAFSLLFLNVVLETVVLKPRLRHCRHIILSLVSSSYLLLGALNTTGVATVHNNGFALIKKERLWRVVLSGAITVVCLLWQVVIVTYGKSIDKIYYPQILGLIITEIIVIILHFQMASMFDNEIVKAQSDSNNDHQRSEQKEVDLEISAFEHTQ